MPDEVGTEATRSDAPSVDDSLFGDAPAAEDKNATVVEGEDASGKDEQDPQVPGDAADDKPAAAVEEEDSTDQTEQDGQGSDDAGEQDAKTEAAEDKQAADDAGEETGSSDDLKVVVSIKGGKAVIGVQKPSADPHIETFDDADLTSLAQEVVAVTERARARWEETPKHPAYERPAPPARRRNRRQQGTTQAADAEGETAQEEQQQTLRLF